MRYLALTQNDRQEMLEAIGVNSVEDLFRDVPQNVQLKKLLDLPGHMGEWEVENYLDTFANANQTTKTLTSFLGAGAYRHHLPAAVDSLIQRGEFLTSYTPYQPEVSQGTLQYLFEFQTQVALLTGMDVANASLYDGASGTAEAALMANRITKRNKVLISGGLHPHYTDAVNTYAHFAEFDVETLEPNIENEEDLLSKIDDTYSCCIIQNPSLFGQLYDLSDLSKKCHEHGVLLAVVVTEVISLSKLKSPGSMGADIVVAEGQSLGNPLNYGGPYLGLMATRDKYVRHMPGRISGQTVDSDGKRGWVLTLAAREQHIRRERATSNICTNSGLCALAFTIHLALLGEKGFRRLGDVNHANAVQLAEKLEKIPQVTVVNDTFFNEFTLKLPKNAGLVMKKLLSKGLLAGVPLSRLYPEKKELAPYLLVAATELTTEADQDKLVARLKVVLQEAL
ncbi:MAG: aminomethyl-transferring glycine dehydrogenase subunit GcvPA [Alphaproteobacteria bacterium]|nr:aminomethyl-transferring glycine dehydrogenase subunit GcvPA [Alphaproteobacteria bacterium]